MSVVRAWQFHIQSAKDPIGRARTPRPCGCLLLALSNSGVFPDLYLSNTAKGTMLMATQSHVGGCSSLPPCNPPPSQTDHAWVSTNMQKHVLLTALLSYLPYPWPLLIRVQPVMARCTAMSRPKESTECVILCQAIEVYEALPALTVSFYYSSIPELDCSCQSLISKQSLVLHCFSLHIPPVHSLYNQHARQVSSSPCGCCRCNTYRLD